MPIPPGKFLMGSPESERERHEHEGPQHNVKISTSFYMGAYPVTQREFETIMHHNPAHFHQSNGGGEWHPVERVKWQEAMKFCDRLSNLPDERSAGRSYRLPTEAEWEFACRAGSSTIFHFGDTLILSQANFDGSQPYGDASPGVSPGKTTPIGSYPSNAFGLFDTHGNVWEWCSDWADWPELGHFYRISPPSDPTGPLHGSYRIMRGGSWADPGKNCRSASRGAASPGGKKEWIGFRVVCKQENDIR